MNIRSAAAGLKWASIAKVVGQGITWLITLYVIRLLDPSDYGATALAAVFVSLFSSVAELGLGASLVQAKDVNEEEAGRIAAASLVLNVACAAVIAVGSPLLGWLYNDERIAAIAATSALTLLFNGAATVPESLLYRHMRFKRLALADVIGAVTGSVTTLLMALSGMGVWSLVIGPILGAMLRAIALIRLSKWIRPQFSMQGIASHLRFGGELTAGRLAWQASQQCDVLIGGRLVSEAALGLYAVSMHLARIPLHKVMGIINQVAFPAVARMQANRPELASRMVDAIALLTFIALPVLWGLSSVAQEVVAVVLGEHWAAATLPLQVAAAAIPAQLLSNVFSTALAGLGRADVELRNMLCTLALTLLAVAVGGQMGASGLALGWSAAALGGLAINLPRTNRVIGLPVRGCVRAIRGPLLAGLCMYAAVTGSRTVLDELGAAARLPCLIAIGAAVYAAVVTTLSPNNWLLLRRAASTVRSA